MNDYTGCEDYKKWSKAHYKGEGYVRFPFKCYSCIYMRNGCIDRFYREAKE